MPLASSWTRIQDEFFKRSGDAAYWYTERTNVGVLAAAAWSLKIMALEEYQVTKRKSEPGLRAEHKAWKGRCDLWLSGPKFGPFVVEAKMLWVHLRSKSTATQAEKSLALAESDVRSSVARDKKQAAVAVSFVVPYLPKAQASNTTFRKDLVAFVESLDEVRCGLAAWSFPHRTRGLLGQGDRNYFPGVVLLATRVQ